MVDMPPIDVIATKMNMRATFEASSPVRQKIVPVSGGGLCSQAIVTYHGHQLMLGLVSGLEDVILHTHVHNGTQKQHTQGRAFVTVCMQYACLSYVSTCVCVHKYVRGFVSMHSGIYGCSHACTLLHVSRNDTYQA
jgi:hypothetical protein